MKMVCIIENESSSKMYNIINKVTKFGFDHIIPYLSWHDEFIENRYLSEEEIEQLRDKDFLMAYRRTKNGVFALPRPIGGKKKIVAVGKEDIEHIKRMYGKQVITVYIENGTEKSNEHILEYDIVLSKDAELDDCVMEILEMTKNR